MAGVIVNRKQKIAAARAASRVLRNPKSSKKDKMARGSAL